MIRLFLKWLKDIIETSDYQIKYELYTHETGNIQKAVDFWSKTLSCDSSRIKVYLKKHKIQMARKNGTDSYRGLVRIRVRKSSILNRKISAWIEHICNYWGVV